MSMCAGVQNVSRPIVVCQEMSHMMPAVMQVMATASSRPGHKAGTLARESATEAALIADAAFKLKDQALLNRRIVSSRQRNFE